jgi:hypothetical protein
MTHLGPRPSPSWGRFFGKVAISNGTIAPGTTGNAEDYKFRVLPKGTLGNGRCRMSHVLEKRHRKDADLLFILNNQDICHMTPRRTLPNSDSGVNVPESAKFKNGNLEYIWHRLTACHKA